MCCGKPLFEVCPHMEVNQPIGTNISFKSLNGWDKVMPIWKKWIRKWCLTWRVQVEWFRAWGLCDSVIREHYTHAVRFSTHILQAALFICKHSEFRGSKANQCLMPDTIPVCFPLITVDHNVRVPQIQMVQGDLFLLTLPCSVTKWKRANEPTRGSLIWRIS